MNYLLLTTLFLAETTEPVGVPALVPVAIGVILLLLFWWGLNRNSIPQGAAAHAEADNHADDHHETPVAVTAPVAEMNVTRETAVPLTEPTAPDDLKIIEGIGPKIEGILQDAGIHTFAELAMVSVSQLEKIVREDAGIRIAFPDTWPEQARLAAAGEWAKLEQLQDELKGGRRDA